MDKVSHSFCVFVFNYNFLNLVLNDHPHYIRSPPLQKLYGSDVRTIDIDTFRLRQNGLHFADAIFELIFSNEIRCILIQIS